METKENYVYGAKRKYAIGQRLLGKRRENKFVQFVLSRNRSRESERISADLEKQRRFEAAAVKVATLFTKQRPYSSFAIFI